VASDPARPSLRSWPLRLRLTAAFASVIALVLTATGGLVYVQFARDLDARTNEELTERQSALQGLAREGLSPVRLFALSGEPFAQLYDTDGAPTATTRRLGAGRLLTPAQVADARSRPRFTDVAQVPGTDDGARVRAFAIGGGRTAAIAEPRDGRESELRRLAALLAIGLPGALLLASLAGYQVAGAALRPVERLRARAAAIGEADLEQRLPQPGTRDELDRLAATLNDLLARLAAALERERRIVSDASHELRTPISVLLTRLDVALRGDQGSGPLRAALEGARGDTVRLARLAEDLLVLARADQGGLPLRLEPTDVQDLLEQVAARHRAAGGPIDVHVDIAGGAAVLADPDRVEQALDNLVVNALRHGGPPVTLRAWTRPDGAVALGVRDHGGGFPAAFLPRAFDRFSQAHAASAEGGSGLGLAITDAIARAHGGAVTVENHAGGGAQATLILPAA
jgi:signal transduction histidine kinase